MSLKNTIDQRKKNEADFQNKRSLTKYKGEARGKFYFIVRKGRAKYQETLQDIKDKKVLIVGCAEGAVIDLFRRGAVVIGVDIAEHAITHLKTSIKKEGLDEKCSAFVMDAENLDFPPNTFDIICCSGVLHHLDIDKAMSCWTRVLKPHGRITMFEPMAWNPVVALYRLLTPSLRTKYEHPLTPTHIKILRKYFGRVDMDGFALTSVLTIITTLIPPLYPYRKQIMRTLEKLDDLLLRRKNGLVYFCWTSVIQLSGSLKNS